MTAMLRQALWHAFLLSGAVICLAPFAWLVSSSFKEHDEFFAVPPVWIPELPARVEASPYLRPADAPPVPDGIEVARWHRLLPQLHAAVRQAVQQLHIPSVLQSEAVLPGVLDELSQALVTRLVQRHSAELTHLRADEIVGTLVSNQPLLPHRVGSIWEAAVRAVLQRPERSIHALDDLSVPPAASTEAGSDLRLAAWAAGVQAMGGYRWEEELERRFARPAAWEAVGLRLGGALWADMSAGRRVASTRTDDGIITLVSSRVAEPLVRQLWRGVFRGLLVGSVQGQRDDGERVALTGAMRTDSESDGIAAGPSLLDQERAGTLLRYQLSDNPTSLRLPLNGSLFDPQQIRRVMLPLRGDRSYHDVVLSIASGGRLYRASEPVVLDNDRWMDAIWSVDEPSLRERRTVYYSASLVPLRQIGAAAPGQEWVQLDIEPVSYARVIARRLARNYVGALLAIPFAAYLWNTLLITGLNIGASLLSCTVVAYGFSRIRWPGRDVLFGLLLATMMLPPQVTMIPQFLIWRGLGQYDTYQPLWLPALFGTGFFVFLMRQFMLSIPRELDDAARIDGCGHPGILRHVIAPLVKPALAAVAVFQFVAAWNDFLGPLIYLSSEDKAPLSLGLFHFTASHFVGAVGEVGLLMAASLLMVLPVLALFFFAQRTFIQGVTFTGLKA